MDTHEDIARLREEGKSTGMRPFVFMITQAVDLDAAEQQECVHTLLRSPLNFSPTTPFL